MLYQTNLKGTQWFQVVCKIIVSNRIPKSGTNIRECNTKKIYLISISKRKIIKKTFREWNI